MRARLIRDLTPLDPYTNLSIEEAINSIPIDAPSFRIWVNRPAAILGRFDELLREVDIGYCVDNGIYIARRHSGGGTVYHDEGNLNITLTLPRTYGFDLYACYRVLAEVIIHTLGNLGVKAEFVEPNEVIVDGLKISGMAGSLTKYSLQCHSTLLVSSDLTKLRRSLRRLKREVTSLSLKISRYVDLEEVSGTMIEVLGNRLKYALTHDSLSEEELVLARELYASKHSLVSWVYSR